MREIELVRQVVNDYLNRGVYSYVKSQREHSCSICSKEILKGKRCICRRIFSKELKNRGFIPSKCWIGVYFCSKKCLSNFIGEQRQGKASLNVLRRKVVNQVLKQRLSEYVYETILDSEEK